MVDIWHGDGQFGTFRGGEREVHRVAKIVLGDGWLEELLPLPESGEGREGVEGAVVGLVVGVSDGHGLSDVLGRHWGLGDGVGGFDRGVGVLCWGYSIARSVELAPSMSNWEIKEEVINSAL